MYIWVCALLKLFTRHRFYVVGTAPETYPEVSSVPVRGFNSNKLIEGHDCYYHNTIQNSAPWRKRWWLFHCDIYKFQLLLNRLQPQNFKTWIAVTCKPPAHLGEANNTHTFDKKWIIKFQSWFVQYHRWCEWSWLIATITSLHITREDLHPLVRLLQNHVALGPLLRLFRWYLLPSTIRTRPPQRDTEKTGPENYIILAWYY